MPARGRNSFLERFSQILSPSSGCGFAPRRPAASTMRGIACFAVPAGLVLTDDEWLYTRAQNQHDTAACWRPESICINGVPRLTR